MRVEKSICTVATNPQPSLCLGSGLEPADANASDPLALSVSKVPRYWVSNS